MPSNASNQEPPPGKRPDPAEWGYSPGYFGGPRVTVDALQQQSKHRSRRRRSRRPRGEETSKGHKIWIVVGLVVVGWLGFLGLMMVSARIKAARAPAAPVQAVPPAPAADDSAMEAANAKPVSSAIDLVRRAHLLAEDGRRLVRAGQLAAAEKKFEDADRLTPNVSAILFDWSRVLRDQQKWAASRDVLMNAVMVAPDSAAARLALAGTCYQLKQLDDAAAAAEWVLEKEPYSEPAFQLLAEIAVARGQHNKASEYWKKLAAINTNPGVRVNLGVSYLKAAQYEQALVAFDGVIKSDPANSQAYYYMAITLAQKKDLDAAAEVLARSVDRFGYPFVQAWTMSREFDVLREHPVFTGLFAESVPAPAAP